MEKNQIQYRKLQELSKCKVMLEEGGGRKKEGRREEGRREEGGKERREGSREGRKLLDSPMSKSTEEERQGKVGETSK